jgi:hypothetical protein
MIVLWALAAIAVLAVAGLLVKAAIGALDSKAGKGIVILMIVGALTVIEHLIFDLIIPSIPAGVKDEITRCSSVYIAGCPGYSPPATYHYDFSTLFPDP